MIIQAASEHDIQVELAAELMEKKDYAGAVLETGRVLDNLEPHVSTVAQASLTRAKAMIHKLMSEMEEKGERPPPETIDTLWSHLETSKRLNPECGETIEWMHRISGVLRKIPPPWSREKTDFDVLVIGAGSAGVGTALMLTETFGLDQSRVLMVERGEVGESFRRWPKEMKFISPSFNQQGWTKSFDLNAIASGTSPAFTLHAEHPSGDEYAAYLEAVVKVKELNVRRSTEVVEVRSVGKGLPLFSVDIRSVTGENDEQSAMETLSARYIIWAAGEFQYPWATGTPTKEGQQEEKKSEGDEGGKGRKTLADERLPGSELCLHNSRVSSWSDLPGDNFIIIGGYESGVDASVNLSRAGKGCKVLASTPTWSTKDSDPSVEIAPYTTARLREAISHPNPHCRPELYAPIRVDRIARAPQGGYNVTASWKAVEVTPHAPLRVLTGEIPTVEPGEPESTLVLHTPHPPILCTGFQGSVAAAAGHLFDFVGEEHKGCLEGAPLLDKNDESTKVPGVFLVGPTVSHGDLSFCFVYKFRQRFAVVANAICRGLGKDTRAAVEECRKNNMYMDDFSCCQDTCGDVC